MDLQEHILKKSPLRVWEQPFYIQQFFKNLPAVTQRAYGHADFLFLWDDEKHRFISDSELASYLSMKFDGLSNLDPHFVRFLQLQQADYWFINVVFAEKYVAIKLIQPETIRQSQNPQDEGSNYWYLTNYNIKPMDTHLLFYDSGDVKQFAKGHYVNASLRKLGLDFCKGQLFYDFPVFQLVSDFQKELPLFLSPVRGMMTYTEILAQSSRKNVLLNKWKSLSQFNHLINLNRLRYWELNLFRTLKLKVTDKEFSRVTNWYYQNGREIFQTNLMVDLQTDKTISATDTITWKDLYVAYIATRFQTPLFEFPTPATALLQTDINTIKQSPTLATQFLFADVEDLIHQPTSKLHNDLALSTVGFNYISSSVVQVPLRRTTMFYTIRDYLHHHEQLHKSHKFEINITEWHRFVELEQTLAQQVQNQLNQKRMKYLNRPFQIDKKWKPLLERLKKSTLEITHLNTIAQLHEEGIKQHNCVGTYAKDVANNNCIIFHYVYKTVPHTVEIVKKGQQYHITQCFAACNQPTTTGALAALNDVINA